MKNILINNNNKKMDISTNENNICLNFMELINRDNNMTLEYKNKFMDKLKEEFTEEEQNLYVANLYIYLHFDDNDYPINLENVYKWIGYSNKGNAKRTLANNFTLDIDYKILLIKTDENINNENQLLTKEKLGGSGLNNEKIMLKVDTFKELCLLSKADNGKVIRKYYIKLEKINNFLAKQQLLEFQEKQKLLENKLESALIDSKNSKRLIEEKEKIINDILDEKYYGYIYIGHDPAIENLTKIGVSTDILKRKNTHNISNPSFVYTFTHKSVNYKEIEILCKTLCKNYLKNKSKIQSEWYNINIKQMEDIIKFCIISYDDCNISNNLESLLQFVNNCKKKNQDKLTDDVIFFDQKIYKEYTRKNIVMNEHDKTPCTLLEKDFEKWVNINYPGIIMRKDQGNGNNFKIKFLEELYKNVNDITNCERQRINLTDKMRNYRFTKVNGFVGFELKSMKNKNFIHFDIKIYNTFLDNTLHETYKKNVTQKELVLKFLEWIDINKYKEIKPLYISEKSNDVVESLKLELKECILKKFPNSIYKKSVCNGAFFGIPGYTNLILKY